MSENNNNNNYTSLEQSFSLGNGQDSALNWLKNSKQQVAVFLISGIKLEGVVSGHDQYSLLLTDSHGNQQLIYKAKISTITLANQTKPHVGVQRGTRKPISLQRDNVTQVQPQK
ncbi:MAG: RNA chaperone Hfq [Succinivibrionaceae bacterium]